MSRTASSASLKFRDMGTAALLACGIVAAASLTALAYWPGLMTWDAIRQYGQAIDGDFDDWHPPAMEWLWRQFIPIQTGPAPMLILQLALYWGGFALIAGWALRQRRRGLAVALAACGLLPLSMALMGAVLKDCLMAGALLTTTGLLFWSDDSGSRWRWPLRGLGIALLLFAAMLRFNAFLAALPLFVALLPLAWRSTWLRMAVSAITATILLMLALPLANRAIGAESSGVELSLIIFDLGGITEHSGVNVFPPMGVADPVAANHACYSPVKWDSYSFWVDPLCPLGFDPMRAAVKAHAIKPYRFWAGAILAHPVAYAEHRLVHFNINTRFLIRHQVERPVQAVCAPNDWNYTVTPNPILSAIDWAALASAKTPLGWPIAWIALAFGVLMLSPTLPSRRLIVPMALSALLYGLGYGVFSVASELRYHLWTMIAALIAAVLAGGDLFGMPIVPWRRVSWSAAPLLVVLVLATAWRVLPLG